MVGVESERQGNEASREVQFYQRPPCTHGTREASEFTPTGLAGWLGRVVHEEVLI